MIFGNGYLESDFLFVFIFKNYNSIRRRRLDRGMKVILFALFVALLMVGCGEEVVEDASNLRDQNGGKNLSNEETLTERIKSFHGNRLKKNEARDQDGKRVDENLLLPGKKIHFKFRDGEGPVWTVSFFENGVVIHSARPKGSYKIKGLSVFVVDFEPVTLVFKKPNIAVGDVFSADSPSAKETLFFKILKVEPITRPSPDP